MSDAPQGAGWWYAADGRWYPPPYPTAETTSGSTNVDGYPSRPPTAAPDHPPLHMVDGASGFPMSEPVPVVHPRRSKALWAVSAVAVILAIAVIALTLALVGRGPGNFRAASQQYDVVVADILDAEDINLIFLDTFWQTYAIYIDEWDSATPERRPEITERFLDDITAQIDQFRFELNSIDGSLVSRAFDDGSAADDIRDAAVAHYRAWDDWASVVPDAATSWATTDSALTLDDWIDDRNPELNRDINSTFRAVCAELSDQQPSDGSYEDLIFEICAP